MGTGKASVLSLVAVLQLLSLASVIGTLLATILRL